MSTALPAADTLRVMTWNILYDTSPTGGGSGEERWPLVLEGIRGAAPDLLAMQEVLPGRLAVLPRDLPGYELAVSEPGGGGRAIAPLLAVSAVAVVLLVLRRRRHRASPPRGGWRVFSGFLTGVLWLLALGIPAGLAFGSWYVGGYHNLNERLVFAYRPEKFRLVEQKTWWFSPTPTKPGSRHPFSFEPRIAQLGVFVQLPGGETLSVVNVHPGHSPANDVAIAELLRAILDRRWNGGPQILLGDFNATVDRQRIALLMVGGARGMPGFRDAWEESPVKTGPAGTFQWGHPDRGRGDLRIDHVFVRGPLRTVRAETRGVVRGNLVASDHDAVVVDLVRTVD